MERGREKREAKDFKAIEVDKLPKVGKPGAPEPVDEDPAANFGGSTGYYDLPPDAKDLQDLARIVPVLDEHPGSGTDRAPARDTLEPLLSARDAIWPSRQGGEP